MKPICSICQCDLLDDGLDQYGADVIVVKVAPCGHVYHKHCVQNLHDYHERTTRNREPLGCPICRQLIVSAEGELQWEPIFLSAEDESASQRRPADKNVVLSTRHKSILALAKEFKDQSRDALVVKKAVGEQNNLRKSSREGVFQQLADWADRLQAKSNAIEEAGAVELLADNIREWQAMSGAIITACEETRRLPEVIESYKLRISTLQAKIRENEARMTEQERTHRRDKLDSSARFRQKEVDLAHEFREKEVRLKADFDKEVQMWRTKFQTAQDSGNNAANALHAQLRQTEALTEQLDAAKNDENLAKGRLQSLRHKLAKKQEECSQAQTTIEAYQREIAELKGANEISARRIQEMSAQHQSSRRIRLSSFSDDDMREGGSPEADTTGGNEESLLVEAPTFDSPSRRKRNIHPTLRVLHPRDIRMRDARPKGSNVIAFASDEEGRDKSPNKRMKNVQGHARNPFATVSKENINRNTERVDTASKGRAISVSKSRFLDPSQDVIVLDASSDPAEPVEDEVSFMQMKTAVEGQGNDGRGQRRLVGGMRHLSHPPARSRALLQRQLVIQGNRASGPRMTRRAV
ncbi:hypothetical protein NliqN6_4863 [Naganishia liquefaciens]|uniref:RING-type domain-containing protein n=1 Tax=Naganishia liquefaciens TaxID=104408 RepID=A0A8H3TX12_9TREE|nr:hypothetical protein NliqN6_4863 [Naganishia liquefaciens]